MNPAQSLTARDLDPTPAGVSIVVSGIRCGVDSQAQVKKMKAKKQVKRKLEPRGGTRT